MSTSVKLTEDEEGDSQESLMLKQFMVSSNNIKGTTYLGLQYPKKSDIETIVYVNFDYARDYVDRKSTRIESARATPTANLPYRMFLTRLFRYVMENYLHLDNGIYNVVDRVRRLLALKQTQKPRSTSRASIPSPTSFLNSLSPLKHHTCNIPTTSQQSDDLLFERQTTLLTRQQQMHEEIRGIYHETTAPYTLQQNGVAERKNRALKEIVNDMLSYSGLSDGFWGEAMAVVRLPDPKIKTLGEKGIDCVFVGYDEHSKAYRFYVIEPNDSVSINIIIELKDAILECFSSIPRPKDIIPNSNESQRDGHSNDVPSETPESESIDDEIGLIMENNTWVLSDLPPCCKWIFKRKMKVDGTIYKFKARLIVNSFGSYSQSSDLSNGCQNIIFYGDLEEEVYMKQSEGFVMPGNEHKSDKYVCSKFDGSGKGVIICLYVDDMLIFGIDQNQVDKTKKFLSSKFSMKDMGKADVILDCSPVSTPMDLVEKLMPNTGKPVDQLEYSRIIGCLMYDMTSTRLDIAYAVDRLSRFTSNPSRLYWHAITRVFKYLKGTMNYGLSYVGYPSVLKGYSDASWINHVEDSSSTSGWVFLLGGGAISWAFKKQTCITSSTMESEFVALVAAGKEGEWLRNLIHEILI
ncbi:zinc finger, CCHC-type containing protein [Tanacetum coccineum]